MGSFANQLFTLMMGWIQSACAAVWQAFSGTGEPAAINWLQEHWLIAAFVLCVLGAAADLIVYLFRWHPIEVWRSFFRRIKERAEERRSQVMQPSAPDEEDTAEETAKFGQKKTDQRPAMLQKGDENALTRLEKAEESLLRSGKRRFRTKYFDSEGEYAGASAAPQEIFNTQDSYHQPVYPRKWRSNDRNGSDAEP